MRSARTDSFITKHPVLVGLFIGVVLAMTGWHYNQIVSPLTRLARIGTRDDSLAFRILLCWPIYGLIAGFCAGLINGDRRLRQQTISIHLWLTAAALILAITTSMWIVMVLPVGIIIGYAVGWVVKHFNDMRPDAGVL
jgi:hypothetical protein